MIANFFNTAYSKHIARAAMLAMCAMLTACVSSTLQTPTQTSKVSATTKSNATATELALSEEQRQNHDARLRAIEDIHTKAAAATQNDEAPSYGVPREGEVAALTPAEIAQKTQSLEATSANAQKKIPDSEVAAKQRAIAAMRRKGNTHYQNALSTIKKSN